LSQARARLEEYASVMVATGIYPSKQSRLLFYLRQILGDVDFRRSTVLDIGCGAGSLSFYAGTAGADRVVGLEPEAAGSHADMQLLFDRARRELQLEARVDLVPKTLQAFDSHSETFDIILMHNSINHLDESACATLQSDSESRSVYQQAADRISALAQPEAKLVICDCSSKNLYPRLGLPNPFAPAIEWEKHQPPSVWADLFKQAGFAELDTRWTSFNRLGRVGRMLTSNKPVAYLLTSHFCLTMRKGV
jgi:SAM-dependent methyltransferase